MDKKVFICSPFAATAKDKDEKKKETIHNIHTAQAASLYAVMEGAIPYTPHLYFPQFLDDDDKDCRELGQRRKEWRRATKEIEERKEQTTENKKTHQTQAWKEENNGMMC